MRDRRGNVAMMWGLVGAFLVGLIGITIDFTRAQAIRAQMQNAVDGAALVAERTSNLSMADRTAAARAFFEAELGDLATTASFNVVQLHDGGHRVEANMPMPLSLGRVITDRDWDVRVVAEAQANASPPIEVALVLDNTGSMRNDMQALRDAAEDLAGTLLNLDGDTVHVALVPFVAQVNIGNGALQRSWLDQAGLAAYNGELIEDRSIAHMPVETRSNRSGYTGANCEALSTLPYAGYTGPYRIVWRKSSSLLGGSRCYAFTPEGVNYVELHDLISNSSWKGCVEARPEPFDISDNAPDVGDPDTMFVPYFWLDTTDGYSNSYLTDTLGDISGATMSSSLGSSATTQERREARMFNVFKYNRTAGSITTSAPDARGPNRGCPTPIVPLTTNRSTVITAIRAMRDWSGGGTNQAEGLAWGWRVISPGPPFTEGRPYGDDVRKVIVLMSDGQNTNVGSDPVFASDYSAYNHMGLWRDYANGNILTNLLNGLLFGILPTEYRRNISSASNYVTYVNGRQRALCTAIKREGIEIYTVIFRETDSATVRLMRDCATSTSHYYRADNAQQLQNAFNAIGTGIGALRLTR
ncbi:MAG TPA: pilus assembly protein TadG-related protein [Terricaulis sp.]|nr:pilus assembly protein TadG-related protein [Terricaulis sp.]